MRFQGGIFMSVRGSKWVSGLSSGLSGLMTVAVVFAAISASSCGKEPVNDQPGKEPMPFTRLKLKNMSPPGGHPATGRAVGLSSGRPIEVGPVPPGETQAKTEPGSVTRSVTVSVIFFARSTLTGAWEFPNFVTSVDIEASEGGGTATVNFQPGEPSMTMPLMPAP
jgi:hypothetical protein